MVLFVKIKRYVLFNLYKGRNSKVDASHTAVSITLKI